MDVESECSTNSHHSDDGIEISHIKGLLSIILEGTPAFENFIDENQVDLSSPVNLQWVEKLSRELNKDTDLFCGTNTRGVPQKLLSVLRDCVIMHRWCEASQVLAVCHQEKTCDLQLALWKVGMEIIYSEFQLGGVSMCERLKKLQNLLPNQPLHASYMHTEYLLYQSTLDDPKKTLQAISTGPSLPKQFRKSENLQKNKYYQSVLSAYQGLMWYKLWVKVISQDDATDKDEHSEHLLSSYLDKMSECFSSFYQDANVLNETHDIIIVPHVRTLEHCRKFDEAKELLRKYRSLNPQNPNAHKYYYNFLCRTNSEVDEQLEVLKTLAAHVPSDPLVLTLCNHLRHEPPSCLMYLFNLLDHECWIKNPVPWKKLVKILAKMPSVDSLSETLYPLWSERKSWWPQYHFPVLSVPSQFKDSTEKNLYLTKAMVALYLRDPRLEYYINTVNKLIVEEKDIAKITSVKTFFS